MHHFFYIILTFFYISGYVSQDYTENLYLFFTHKSTNFEATEKFIFQWPPDLPHL